MSELDARCRYCRGCIGQCRTNERKQLVARDKVMGELEPGKLDLQLQIHKDVNIGETREKVGDDIEYALDVFGFDADLQKHQEVS